MDEVDATNAAYEVCYESGSQFNQEYSRFFVSVRPNTRLTAVGWG
jgi:hypothetical protein